ncbi:hypothetical protein ACS0TY_029913 [Phlomoides rotata]
MMDITYRPYFDSEFEVLIERLHPPRVCIDNETYQDCTLVKVDSANKQGMLLEMVQVLTDLDLLISKSYISSDGGWLMDVFHVTDQHRNKLTDESLIRYIEEAICSSRNARPKHLSTEHLAFEVTGIDRPGMMSEMSAVLAELGCHVSAAVAWTHKTRAACILYVEGGPNMDPSRVSQVQAQLENVVEAHHRKDELRSVRLAAPIPGRTHTERRLHQLMAADRDYEECCSCCGGSESEWDEFYTRKAHQGCDGTHVSIENCKENDYLIITVKSRDRPKLLFDTLCTLTDLNYEVHHAAISSRESTAFQEYYVKQKDGYTLDSETEQLRVIQCLIASTERRIYHGLRLDICIGNRNGLLSDVTRVLRENGLSINSADIGVRGENAVGTFYVKDATGQNVSPEIVESVRREIGGHIVVENVSLETPSQGNRSRTSSGVEDQRSRFSLGNLLWSQLERLSNNFGLIKS